MWSAASGQRLRTLAGHHAPVESLTWSPDGKQLATASDDGTVKVWRTDTWRPVTTLRETFPDVGKEDGSIARQALYSPDGRTLAVVSIVSYHGEPGSQATRIVLWDTAGWKRQRMLLDENYKYPCWRAMIAFTPDSRRLAAATKGMVSDGEVYAWDLPAGTMKNLGGTGEASYSAALIPPGRWLAAGGTEWTAFLLDTQTGETVATLPHPSEVMAMAAAPDGRTRATGDSDGFVRLWPMPALPVRPPTQKSAGPPDR